MSGMIQKVEGAEVAAENTEPTNNGETPSWFWDENTPGQGERPQWLEAKYNKVVDQAKGYKELEKMMGKANPPIPEDYDLNEYNEIFDLESPYFAELKNKGKEHRISQDALKSIVDGFANYQKSLMPNIDEEIAKLGEHAQTRINTVNTWATNHLSEKAIETLGRISNTADVVELMDEVRQLYLQTASQVPAGHAPVKAEIVTPEMIQQEIVSNYEKFKTDPHYRREMQLKLQRAVGDE